MTPVRNSIVEDFFFIHTRRWKYFCAGCEFNSGGQLNHACLFLSRDELVTEYMTKRACVRVINKFAPVFKTHRGYFRFYIENPEFIRDLVEKLVQYPFLEL